MYKPIKNFKLQTQRNMQYKKKKHNIVYSILLRKVMQQIHV